MHRFVPTLLFFVLLSPNLMAQQQNDRTVPFNNQQWQSVERARGNQATPKNNLTNGAQPNTVQPNTAQPNSAQVNGNSTAARNPTTQPTKSSLVRQPPIGAITKVSKGLEVLPNDAGQVWRSYDISPYTKEIQGIDKPEQALVDWILRETGTELWFSEPLGILSAGKDEIRVYHTPEIQQKVLGVIDRFVGSKGRREVLGIRLTTVGNPNWRAIAQQILEPIDVKSPGVEAWVLSKENAALLLGELRKRSDFQQHNSPIVTPHNGQSMATARTRPQSYSKGIQWVPSLQRYEYQVASFDEGYKLQISPLRSLDGKTMDALIKCDVNQIEKMRDVTIEVPTVYGKPESVKIQVPQFVSWKLTERFQWPTDKVLLLSCGVVAAPNLSTKTVPRFLAQSKDRADALLFVECKGPMQAKPSATSANLVPNLVPNVRR